MPLATLVLAAAFTLCSPRPRINCVVDGDTFWVSGEKVRIADINAPETHGAECADEQARGEAATRRLLTLLNSGPIRLVSAGRDKDRYGRSLRIVVRNGRSLGADLVRVGLAEPWSGRRRNWC
jgi:endonuclease YncB( thermonuclease family)